MPKSGFWKVRGVLEVLKTIANCFKSFKKHWARRISEFITCTVADF